MHTHACTHVCTHVHAHAHMRRGRQLMQGLAEFHGLPSCSRPADKQQQQQQQQGQQQGCQGGEVDLHIYRRAAKAPVRDQEGPWEGGVGMGGGEGGHPLPQTPCDAQVGWSNKGRQRV